MAHGGAAIGMYMWLISRDISNRPLAGLAKSELASVYLFATADPYRTTHSTRALMLAKGLACYKLNQIRNGRVLSDRHSEHSSRSNRDIGLCIKLNV